MVFLRLLSVAVVLAALPSLTLAQLVSGRLISSVYAWEKFDTVDVSERFGRGFQSVLLDVSHSGFSLHTHLQGALNLQKNLDETPDFRAWYLYGKVREIAGVIDLSVGRLPFYAGVGHGTLDGALTTFRIAGDAARLTLYGGAPAPVGLGLDDWQPLASSHLFGGQFHMTTVSGLRIGLSYFREKRIRPSYTALRADSLFNPVTALIEPEPERRQLAGLDAAYRLDGLRLYGRTDYNIDENKPQRAQAGLRYDITDALTFSGDYLYRRPRIATGSFFSVFPSAVIHEIEGGLDYMAAPPWRVFVRAALVQYDGEESIRATAGVAHRYLYLSYRGNSGYAGELSAITLQGSYPLLDRMVTPNASVSYASYRFSKTVQREDAVAAALGATLRPLSLLSLDVQGQWVANRVFSNDLRLFAKLTVWFTEQFHIL